MSGNSPSQRNSHDAPAHDPFAHGLLVAVPGASARRRAEKLGARGGVYHAHLSGPPVCPEGLEAGDVGVTGRKRVRRLKPRRHRVVRTDGHVISSEVWSYESAREREFYVEARTPADHTLIVRKTWTLREVPVETGGAMSRG